MEKTYIHEILTEWEKNSRKGKQRNKCRKNIIGLKISKLKLYKMRKEKKMEEERKKGKKGKLHRTAKAQHRGRGF